MAPEESNEEDLAPASDSIEDAEENSEFEESREGEAEFERRWDDGHESYYFYHWPTGESYWPISADENEQWMEMTDEASGYRYHMHAQTHETYWADENDEAWAESNDGEEAATVWEELKDPLTGVHYYYSNVNGVSQWAEPPWVDYVDTESGAVYYLNTSSGESTWEKPEGFVEEAVDDTETFAFPGQGRGTGDFGASYAAPPAVEVLASVPEEDGGGDAMEVAPSGTDGAPLPVPPVPQFIPPPPSTDSDAAASSTSLPMPTPRLAPVPSAPPPSTAQGAKRLAESSGVPQSDPSSGASAVSRSEDGGGGGGGGPETTDAGVSASSHVAVQYSLSKRPRGKQAGLNSYPLNSGPVLSPMTPRERGMWREQQNQQRLGDPPSVVGQRGQGFRSSGHSADAAGNDAAAAAPTTTIPKSSVAAAYLAAVGGGSSGHQAPPQPPLMPPPPPGAMDTDTTTSEQPAS